MDEPNDTPTRFHVERLAVVMVVDEHRSADTATPAWLPVGTIDWDGDRYRYRDAFVAWAGEQDDEPPLGHYRVIRAESYGWTFHQFEVREHRERVIEQVEHPQLREDIATLSRAALTPAGEGS